MENQQTPTAAEPEQNGKAPQEVPECIIVSIRKTDSGDLQVGFELVGGFSPFAAGEVLELAAIAARNMVGLGKIVGPG
jgi:hypothetical protein